MDHLDCTYWARRDAAATTRAGGFIDLWLGSALRHQSEPDGGLIAVVLATATLHTILGEAGVGGICTPVPGLRFLQRACLASIDAITAESASAFVEIDDRRSVRGR
nr:hypothetical protein [Roseibium sp. RKSG952]